MSQPLPPPRRHPQLQPARPRRPVHPRGRCCNAHSRRRPCTTPAAMVPPRSRRSHWYARPVPRSRPPTLETHAWRSASPAPWRRTSTSRSAPSTRRSPRTASKSPAPPTSPSSPSPGAVQRESRPSSAVTGSNTPSTVTSTSGDVRVGVTPAALHRHDPQRQQRPPTARAGPTPRSSRSIPPTTPT